jgi:hypothetical protein
MVGWVFLNFDTGQVVPARCGRTSCAYCLRKNAGRRARAIALAKPQRAILLTQVGEDWQTVRNRMKVLRSRIAAEVKVCEWCWHVEPFPSGVGHHVHAWQHGSFIPQDRLSRLAASVGMGSFARINVIRSARGASLYGLKGLTYGLKGLEAADEGATYLAENGRRLTHQSRGYFRSGSGAKLAVRAAERLAMPGSGGGTWRLVPGRVPVTLGA